MDGVKSMPDMIDCSKLSEEEIKFMQQQMKAELTNIENSLSVLNDCKAKYAASKDALESFQPNRENRQILVPLTSSMYVPGRIKDMDNFMINIGSGYYVEKNLEDAKDYFKRRIEYVQVQIDKLDELSTVKSHFFNGMKVALEKHAVARKMTQQQQQAMA